MVAAVSLIIHLMCLNVPSNDRPVELKPSLQQFSDNAAGWWRARVKARLLIWMKFLRTPAELLRAMAPALALSMALSAQRVSTHTDSYHIWTLLDEGSMSDSKVNMSVLYSFSLCSICCCFLTSHGRIRYCTVRYLITEIEMNSGNACVPYPPGLLDLSSVLINTWQSPCARLPKPHRLICQICLPSVLPYQGFPHIPIWRRRSQRKHGDYCSQPVSAVHDSCHSPWWWELCISEAIIDRRAPPRVEWESWPLPSRACPQMPKLGAQGTSFV